MLENSAKGSVGSVAAIAFRIIAAICARGETPFLHVFTSNQGAIALYRALGFVDRREMQLLVLGASN